MVNDDASIDLRAHYSGIMRDTLRMLWRRKWLIALTVSMGVVFAGCALREVRPRYTSEALLLLNLDRDVTRGVKSEPIASVNATEVANSAVRIIRSRTIADAVVVQLGLDKQAGYERRPFLSRWLSAIRSALGLRGAAGTPHDLAVDALMRELRVVAEPRSYVISVAVTTDEPKLSAKLANAVAAEYLRDQKVRGVSEARAVAERELANASLTYGPRHPTYLRARARLLQLDRELAALRNPSSAGGSIKFAAQEIIPARTLDQPSGPNTAAYLLLGIVGGLSLGICLARYTRIGFASPALFEIAFILMLAACLLVDGIFAAARAARRARQYMPSKAPLFGGLRRLARR